MNNKIKTDINRTQTYRTIKRNTKSIFFGKHEIDKQSAELTVRTEI